MAVVFLIYGLAFFSMGMAILLEIGHGTDQRLRQALRPLAAFGLIHGCHEWLEMLDLLGGLPHQQGMIFLWDSSRLGLLAFSFVSLSAFGTAVLASNEQLRRFSLLLPLVIMAIWGGGLLYMRGIYIEHDLWSSANVWTRYILGIPGSLLASLGLVFQQREFRREGMARFGQDAMWAAVSFFWYGTIGQLFGPQSRLVPSTFLNQNLFLELFGFPVQLFRALAAVCIAFFVMRFMRSFEVELQRQFDTIQKVRLEDAERRDMQRSEMLHRIVSAQEAERQRIARELHDETGQSLTALGLGLRGVESALKDRGKAAQNLHQLEALVENSLIELQRIIADLRPSHLDDLGLPAALRWYASEIQKRVDLDIVVIFSDSPPPSLPAELRTTLFRIVQEALTNIVKHAQARHVWVRVVYHIEGVEIQVEDDGKGFDLQNLNQSKRVSWGLLGMEERASLLGGKLKVHSQPGRGTRVEVMVPYQAQK